MPNLVTGQQQLRGSVDHPRDCQRDDEDKVGDCARPQLHGSSQSVSADAGLVHPRISALSRSIHSNLNVSCMAACDPALDSELRRGQSQGSRTGVRNLLGLLQGM